MGPDALRKQVRELSEKVDELQPQLFQREGQLLALEGEPGGGGWTHSSWWASPGPPRG